MKRKTQWTMFAGSLAMFALSFGWLLLILTAARKPAFNYPPDGSHGPTPGIIGDTNTQAPPIHLDGPGAK